MIKTVKQLTQYSVTSETEVLALFSVVRPYTLIEGEPRLQLREVRDLTQQQQSFGTAENTQLLGSNSRVYSNNITSA